MSAFLTPIHFRMFAKIQMQERLVKVLAADEDGHTYHFAWRARKRLDASVVTPKS